MVEQVKKPESLVYGGAIELATEEVDLRGGKTVLRVLMGDLILEKTDTIVNAANSELEHIGGLAYAIVKKGGKMIQTECEHWIKAHKKLKIGSAMSSNSGSLPCKKIIHAVGPVGQKDFRKDCQLRWAVISSLKECEKIKMKSIAIPAISSGIFGFPKQDCAEILINAVIDYLHTVKSEIKEVHFTNNDEETCIYFQDKFNILVSEKVKNKEKIGTGGFDQGEKEVFKGLEQDSHPMVKPAPGRGRGRGRGAPVKRGGAAGFGVYGRAYGGGAGRGGGGGAYGGGHGDHGGHGGYGGYGGGMSGDIC